jgi:hypothetical protein
VAGFNLADLFELELDKLANQYEMQQRAEQQRDDHTVDEMVEKLKDLARRQQQEMERQRRMAQSGQQSGSGGSSASQRALADEAEKAARQLQQLTRDQQRQELNDAMRRVQEAADAMRRSAANGASDGGAQANEALSKYMIATVGRWSLAGAAWSGEADIAKVDISTDGGKSWRPVDVLHPRMGYSWYRWEHYWKPPAPGKYTLMCRATNVNDETQPMEFRRHALGPDRRFAETTTLLESKGILRRGNVAGSESLLVAAAPMAGLMREVLGSDPRYLLA